MNERDYMNAVQAAEYLGVTRQRIYELTQAGRLGRRIAGHPVYSQEELDVYKEERASKPRGRPKRASESQK